MKTRAWAFTLALMLSVLSMPQKVWAQSVATDITVSKNLLPDSLKDNVLSIWIDTNGDIFAAMSFKALLRSTDDGKTWERIFKKDFLSNFGFAVMRDQKTNALLFGNGGGLYRSGDNGVSWTFVWEKGAGCFLVKEDGSILAGTGKYIGHSEDGGVSWKPVFYRSDHYFNVEELAVNPKTGSLFAGTADTIGLGVLRSADDGKTWHQSNGGLGDLHVWSVAADSNGTLYAGTENGLYRSVDDGVSWTRIVEIGASHRWARKILAVKPDFVFVGFDDAGGVGGAKSGVLKYDGKAWTQIVADSVSWVGALAVKGKSLLVGTWNAIYRVDGAMNTPTAVDNNYQLLITDYRLLQNYPNPFNPSTTIEFSIPKRANVNLAIYNALGQNVETLVDGEMEPGIHRIVWNARDLPSGVYFHRLEANGFVATRKMLLLK
ncbi:MAG: T9SS type A sorting domain-containing protein [Candidatus Jorgensenbacteria bacterium]